MADLSYVSNNKLENDTKYLDATSVNDLYNRIFNTVIKSMSGKEWLDREDIQDEITSIITSLRQQEIEKDLAYEILRQYISFLIKHDLDTVITKQLRAEKHTLDCAHKVE